MQTLEVQEVLARYELDADVKYGQLQESDGQQRVSFDVRGQLSKGWERLQALKHDLKTALGSVDVDLQEGQGGMRMNFVQPNRPPVELLDILEYLEELPPLTAVLGWSTDNRPTLLDLKLEETSHAFIAGVPGSGKTSLLRTVALSLALANKEPRMQLVLIDPIGTKAETKYEHSELHAFSHLPHLLSPLVRNPQDAADMLGFLVAEAEHRAENEICQPAIVVLIDQIDLLLNVGETEILRPLTNLIMRGAKVGIHLIFSSSRPEDKKLQELLESYIPVRLVGQMYTAEQAEIATEVLDSRAERLQNSGEFLAVVNNLITQFQGAYVGDYDLHLCLDQLQRYRPPTLLAQSFNETPRLSLNEAAASYEVSYAAPKAGSKAIESKETPAQQPAEIELAALFSEEEAAESESAANEPPKTPPIIAAEVEDEAESLPSPSPAAPPKLPKRLASDLLNKLAAEYGSDEPAEANVPTEETAADEHEAVEVEQEEIETRKSDSDEEQSWSDFFAVRPPLDELEEESEIENDEDIPFDWESPRWFEVAGEENIETADEEIQAAAVEGEAAEATAKAFIQAKAPLQPEPQQAAPAPKKFSVEELEEERVESPQSDAADVEEDEWVYEDVDEWISDLGPDLSEDWELEAKLAQEQDIKPTAEPEATNSLEIGKSLQTPKKKVRRIQPHLRPNENQADERKAS